VSWPAVTFNVEFASSSTLPEGGANLVLAELVVSIHLVVARLCRNCGCVLTKLNVNKLVVISRGILVLVELLVCVDQD
jgi:hypothetical protein